MLQLGIPRPSGHRNLRNAVCISELPPLQITEHQPPVDLEILGRQLPRLLEILGRTGVVARIQSALSMEYKSGELLVARLGTSANSERRKQEQEEYETEVHKAFRSVPLQRCHVWKH